jgi:hypothetical protein
VPAHEPAQFITNAVDLMACDSGNIHEGALSFERFDMACGAGCGHQFDASFRIGDAVVAPASLSTLDQAN